MNDIMTEKEYQHFIMSYLEHRNGYHIRHATKAGGDYDRRFAMDRGMLFEFLSQTQTDKLAELRKQYGKTTEETLVNFLNSEITKKGSSLIHVLKHGVDVTPSLHLDLMYRKPATDFNPQLTKLYQQNLFSVMEEVWPDDETRVDLVLFLNGLAIISMELKCNLSGQDYERAIEQYRGTGEQAVRDPKNRLFLFKAGCFVHFAVDLEECYMTTHLTGASTYFMPFNRGSGAGIHRGAGNDVNPETGRGVDYLWEDILTKDTLIDLISKYIFLETKAAVKNELGGRAKAMVITGSREEAVRYKQAFEQYIQSHAYTDVKALVAFSGTVKLRDEEYTEAGMNGFSESRTAQMFDTDAYQLLLVANKYQTGFDQKKLCAMYVLKKLKNVNAVQTLSRLNRICPPYDKHVVVIDFVNTYEDMQNAFAPYYETTLLSGSANPSLIYDLSAKIDGYFVLDPDDIDKFSELLFAAGHGDMKRLDKRKRQKLTAYLARANHRIQEQKEETRREITQTMRHFRRFYQFLLLVSPLSDVELHKKYVFVDYLLSWLNIRHAGGGFDLKGKIEASNFVQRKTSEHAGNPMTSKPVVKLPTAESLHLSQDKEEKLSQIIEEINSRLGKDYDTDVTVKSALQIRDILMKSEDLKRSAQHNTVKDFAFAFNDHLDDALIEGLEQNQEFFSLLLEDDEIKKQVMGIFVDSIYHSMREQA